MLETLTSDDTLTLFNRVFNDFADGDVSVINIPNNIVNMRTGKNQNTIYALDQSGNNADATLRFMRGSSDDIFMQSQYANMLQDFSSFVLGAGQFVKNLGDGQGNVVRDVYDLSGGIFTKQPETSSNQQGGTDQGVAIYHMKFSRLVRALQ